MTGTFLAGMAAGAAALCVLVAGIALALVSHWARLDRREAAAVEAATPTVADRLADEAQAYLARQADQ